MEFRNELYWPSTVNRTLQKKVRRTKRTWAMALAELQKEVKANHLKNVVITANINVSGGVIHSRRGEIGTSVRYSIKTQAGYVHKIAYCDRFIKEPDNLQAIVETLSHYRKIKDLRVGFLSVPLEQQS